MMEIIYCIYIGDEAMRLKEFEFGFADATKEYSRTPEIFERAFCDPRNVVEKLIQSYHFLLIGRKGVGKSAYSSKIQSISSASENLYTYPMNLSDFEFATFAKTGIDEDVSGTQKYKTSWDFLLLWTIFKILYNEMEMTESDKINEVVFLLDKLGFSIDDGYKTDVSKLSKIKVGANIKIFDVEFEREFNTKPATYLERISLISEKMLNALAKAYLNDRQIVVVVDGLDDILRYKKNRMEIIASMIRSADYLNDFMMRSKQKIKIVILVREDIIGMVNDPDLNKIIQDGAIFLSWNNRSNDLKELVNKRFALAGLNDAQAAKCWSNIFPSKIKSKDTWDYVLDYTLYKPRDILQFLKYCQSEYPDNEKLTLSETQNVLKVYSNKYFIEEMKNELSGLIEDELIVSIPSVFRRLGGRGFDIAELNRLTNEQNPKRNVTIEETKTELMYLFEAGYVGQLVSVGKDRKRSVIFKYRNPTARIDYYQKFLTHKGLHSGLGVRL